MITAANHDSWSNAGSYITVLQLVLTAGITGELSALFVIPSFNVSITGMNEFIVSMWLTIYLSDHLSVSASIYLTIYISLYLSLL